MSPIRGETFPNPLRTLLQRYSEKSLLILILIHDGGFLWFAQIRLIKLSRIHFKVECVSSGTG